MIIDKCPICGKGYKNLGWHLGMAHKAEVLNKFTKEDLIEDEEIEDEEKAEVKEVRESKTDIIPSSTSALIRQKMNDIFNIKIMNMLCESKQQTTQELAQLADAINPRQSASVAEMKELFKMFQEMQPDEDEEDDELPYVETPNEWVNVAQQVVPLIREYLAKKQEVKKDVQQGNTGAENDIANANKLAESVIDNSSTTGAAK